MTKQSIYELLGLPDGTAFPEVLTAYQALCRHYESGAHGLLPEEANSRLQALRQAMASFSSEMALTGQFPQLTSAPALLPGTFLDVEPESPVWARRKKRLALAASWLTISLRLVLGLVGLFLVIQIIMLYVSYRFQSTPGDAVVVDKSTEEKIMLEQFYQETGMRAASITEMQLMQAELNRKEEEARKLQEEELAKRTQEREYERFVEESRSIGSQITNRVNYEEEMQRRQEAYRQQQQAEEERYRQEQEMYRKQEEQARIEAEKSKWRSVILNGSQR